MSNATRDDPRYVDADDPETAGQDRSVVDVEMVGNRRGNWYRYALGLLVAFLLLPAATEGQAIQRLEEELRELDPDTAVFVDVEEGVTASYAIVTITDGWYDLRCYQKKRFAKGVLSTWRNVWGENTALAALEDRYGERVAEPGWLGGMDVTGCD